VRGLRDALKRKAIFNSLIDLKYDIIFLQEIYGLDTDSDYWGREWGGEFVFNMFSAREAGVAILFHPSLEIELKNSVKDDNGRLIQTEAVFCNQNLNLVNVYAPSGCTK
jgi:exonuclease III